MFNPKLSPVKLDDEIFLFPSFINKNEIIKIMEDLFAKGEDLFTDTAKNEWYRNKITMHMPSLFSAYSKIYDLVSPEYTILPNLSITRIKTGESMYVHADTPGEDDPNAVTSDDPYETCHVVQYGLVLYLNDDYEGGEIYYPNRNIFYKPNAGDLIIHSAFKDYSHGVKEVTSGTRYVYPNFMIGSGQKPIPKAVLSEVGQLGLEPRTDGL